MNELRKKFLKKSSLILTEKKPRKIKSDLKDAVSNRRNARLAIREAALRGTTCLILYKKATDGKIGRYEVIPTEYDYVRDKNNRLRKTLWVQDCHEGKERRQIKKFYCSRIIKAVVTDHKRRPKWPILIK